MSKTTELTTEEKLAMQQNQELQDVLKAQRRWYVWLAVVFILLSVGIATSGFLMIALVLLVIGLICLSQYFDTNGHLHEVQRRSTKTLVRDFSVLRRTEHESSNTSRTAPH